MTEQQGADLLRVLQALLTVSEWGLFFLVLYVGYRVGGGRK